MSAAERARVTACRGEGCGARIRWARTCTGKSQPLDADPNPSGNVVFTEGYDPTGVPIVETLGPLDFADTRERFMPHHATCPDAGSFHR